MIKSLEIENFILIEKQKLQFDKQLNVLTGDTGSGKSVIINSLKFVFGNRASSELFLDKEQNIRVTANLELTSKLIAKLEEHQIEYFDEVEVMRILAPSGKNKVRINGELVSVTTLADIFEDMITIYSQYSVAKFKSDSNYLQIIDQLQADHKLIDNYTEQYSKYIKLEKQIKELNSQRLLKDEKQELLELRLRDLSDLDDDIDIDQMIAEKKELDQQASSAVVNSKASAQFEVASDALHQLINTVELDSHMQLLNDALINIDEVSFEIAKLSEPVDEMRLNYISDYISMCRRIGRKYNVELNRLVEFKNELQAEFDGLDSIDADIANIQAKADREYELCMQLATELSEIRKQYIPDFSAKVNAIMKKLSLAESDFKINVEQTKLSKSGIDNVQFLVRMNEGTEYTQIHKTASGGEISRFLLALEAATIDSGDQQFIIFDEIDTGVSGHVASEMAAVMKEISKTNKLLIVTHLAQVAAISQNHFEISKQSNGKYTTSSAKLLTEDQKPMVLAKMISGHETSKQAVEHAKTLLA